MSRNPRQGHRAKSAKVAKRKLEDEQTLGEEIIEGLQELAEAVESGQRAGMRLIAIQDAITAAEECIRILKAEESTAKRDIVKARRGG